MVSKIEIKKFKPVYSRKKVYLSIASLPFSRHRLLFDEREGLCEAVLSMVKTEARGF